MKILPFLLVFLTISLVLTACTQKTSPPQQTSIPFQQQTSQDIVSQQNEAATEVDNSLLSDTNETEIGDMI